MARRCTELPKTLLFYKEQSTPAFYHIQVCEELTATQNGHNLTSRFKYGNETIEITYSLISKPQ